MSNWPDSRRVRNKQIAISFSIAEGTVIFPHQEAHRGPLGANDRGPRIDIAVAVASASRFFCKHCKTQGVGPNIFQAVPDTVGLQWASKGHGDDRIRYARIGSSGCSFCWVARVPLWAPSIQPSVCPNITHDLAEPYGYYASGGVWVPIPGHRTTRMALI